MKRTFIHCKRLFGTNSRRIELSEIGPVANLHLKERSELPALKENYAGVKVAYAAVCHRDLLDREGAFPFIKTPITVGHEASGVVTEVGSEVPTTELNVGDKVVNLHWAPCLQCKPCVSGNSSHCDARMHSFFGLTHDGAYSDHMHVPWSALVRVPSTFSAKHASAVMCTHGTVYHGFKRARVQGGERILVSGASGGVGSACVQIAKAMQCHVTALTRQASKVSFLESLGCDDIVLMDVDSKPRLSNVDVSVECVGDPTFMLSLRALRPGGRLLLLGNVTNAASKLPLGLCIVNELSVIGADSITREELAETFEFLDKHSIRPQISHALTLDDARQAHTLLKHSEVKGRIVLECSGEWK